MSYIIKGGNIVTENGVERKEVLLTKGQIKEISHNINCGDAEIIDASGCYVIPGGIDVHTHLTLQAGPYTAQDDFYTGTVAAACGGTTTIIDHPEFGPKGCCLNHQIDKYHERAEGKAVIDYSFHGVFQHVDQQILNDIPKMIEQGITSFKAYLAYDYPMSDIDILQLMQKLKESGGILAIHCENNDILTYYRKKFVSEGKVQPKYHAKSRDDICEADAVNRMICMSRTANNAPLYIVHLSCEASLEYVELAQRNKCSVIAETCPQYLFLDENQYKDKDGLKYILTPPLRNIKNQQKLWNGINKGSISVVATDHCPFDLKLRREVALNDFTKCPNGLPGIETRIPLMFQKVF